MANPIGFPEIAKAVGDRWKASGLDAIIKGGIWANSPPERTPKPYVVLSSLGEESYLNTSKGRYEDSLIGLELVAENLEVMKSLLSQLRGVMGENSLTLPTDNGTVFLKMFPGRVTYLEEANYLRGICEFRVKYKQNRVS